VSGALFIHGSLKVEGFALQDPLLLCPALRSWLARACALPGGRNLNLRASESASLRYESRLALQSALDGLNRLCFSSGV
jgi:hypothetical protein